MGLEEVKIEFAALQCCLREFCLKNGWAEEFDLHWEGIRREENLRRQQRDAKIKECHPDGGHWPPQADCPLCQKVEQMYHKNAVRICKEEGWGETEENLMKASDLFKAGREEEVACQLKLTEDSGSSSPNSADTTGPTK